VVAAHYDTLIDELAEADRDASAHKQDQAAESYEAAVKQADQLLAEVGSRPSPSVSYPTRTEGPLHETALVAKVREQRARALRLAKAAHERSAASARDDLHMKTAGQRAVFAEHGMPRQVRHQRAQTCWYYFSSRAQEVFCWNASGQSTKRKTDAPLRSVSAGWSDALPYDSTATFASGDCKDGGCGRAGWTEHFDGGLGADTDCNAGNCLKHGWTTRFSDGVMATTRCNGGDCSRKGWTTRFSDGGDDAKTECDGGDCLKYGWTTWLRMGYSLDCDCGGVCLTEGANCAH
jgi:hypothetical protein